MDYWLIDNNCALNLLLQKTARHRWWDKYDI